MFFVKILVVVVGHPYLYLALVISGVDFHTSISKAWRIAKRLCQLANANETKQQPESLSSKRNKKKTQKQKKTMTSETNNKEEIQAAINKLLDALWQTSQITTRFSSRPIVMDVDFRSDKRGTFISDNNTVVNANNYDYHTKIISASTLTTNEKDFLEELLQSDDLQSIKTASERLADKTVFPPAEEEESTSNDDDDHPKIPSFDRREQLQRGSSELQLQLFKLHEQHSTIKPSELLRQISMSEKKEDDNSITRGDDDGSWDGGGQTHIDLNAWIDGSQGVEIDNDGTPTKMSSSSHPPTLSPFRILGTSADDVTCHPHILSPPLMESLLAFMPESLQYGYNFWLKYSMARDKPSLLTMLRHCRASVYTILAIETTDGHIFGSFTSEPWRLLLSEQEFYGSKDSFVWRMRQSRNQPSLSIMEQILAESKIDVFPYTEKNENIQFCSRNFLGLGDGELEDIGASNGSHFGNAIRLNASLTTGSTSTSQTFANPSLIHNDKRGEEFMVANVELWGLTPHTSLEGAVRSEMNSLFLEKQRKTKNLNLLEILVS